MVFLLAMAACANGDTEPATLEVTTTSLSDAARTLAYDESLTAVGDHDRAPDASRRGARQHDGSAMAFASDALTVVPIG